MLIHIITFVKYFFSRSRYTIVFFSFVEEKNSWLTLISLRVLALPLHPSLSLSLSLSFALISYANDFDRVQRQWSYLPVSIEKNAGKKLILHGDEQRNKTDEQWWQNVHVVLSETKEMKGKSRAEEDGKNERKKCYSSFFSFAGKAIKKNLDCCSLSIDALVSKDGYRMRCVRQMRSSSITRWRI